MSELVIEKGIPLPNKSTEAQMRNMEIGDSFVTEKKYGSFWPVASKIGIKIACRKQPDGQTRIWRVA